MKMISLVLASVFALSASSAFAAPTAQQNKMADCNKQAKEKALKGDERKKFMSDCLKAAPAAPAAEAAKAEKAPAAPAAPAAEAGKKLAPKEAMKACASASKGKKGDEHKKFMSDCLKAGGPGNMAK
jgi:hypothetical protein